jgi:hypothetical protein
MVHLLASIANDAEYMPALLYALRREARPPETPVPNETWGVGYFADERGLIVRKPASILDERSAFSVGQDLRSHIVMVSARSEADRADAPPFRFRQWLFGYAGDLDPLGRLQPTVAPKLPSFVQSSLGDGHGGRLAHAMFLTELHRAGLLEDPLADAGEMGAALGRTAEALSRLAPEAGVSEVQASFVASNGRVMVVTRAGRPLFMREVRGLERLPDGPVDETLHDFKRIAAALRRFRAQVVTSDVDAERAGTWRRLEPQGTTVVEANLDVRHL